MWEEVGSSHAIGKRISRFLGVVLSASAHIGSRAMSLSRVRHTVLATQYYLRSVRHTGSGPAALRLALRCHGSHWDPGGPRCLDVLVHARASHPLRTNCLLSHCSLAIPPAGIWSLPTWSFPLRVLGQFPTRSYYASEIQPEKSLSRCHNTRLRAPSARPLLPRVLTHRIRIPSPGVYSQVGG